MPSGASDITNLKEVKPWNDGTPYGNGELHS